MMIRRDFFAYADRLGLRRRTAAALLALYLAATVFETVAVTMLLPIMQFIEADGNVAALVAEEKLWQRLDEVTGFLGIPLALVTLLIASFVCMLCRQGLFYVRMIYTARVQERLMRDIRNTGFARYLEADSAYHDAMPVGDLVNTLTTETRRAVITLMSPVQIASYVCVLLVYFAVLFALSAPMTLLAAAILLVVAWGLKHLMPKTASVGRLATQANREMSAFLAERLKSPRLIRLSGMEKAEIAIISKLTAAQRETMVRSSALIARTEVLVEPIVVFIGFFFLYVAHSFFQMALGTIGIFLLIVLRLLPVAKSIISVRQGMLAMLGSLEIVDRTLSVMRERREVRGGDIAFTGLVHGIRFEGVAFRYREGDRPALDGVDLEIPAGKMTALVGPSGSGKSTLIDLLPRLREPQAGRVLFDGRPVAESNTESLRRGIAYVSQMPQIFNVTVAQHIRYGKAGADEAEIREAARLAGAAEFIEQLSDGYDTLLGEDGVRLSGGQRQRLDLARALIRRSPILILDEPTSNLDAEAEASFRETLKRIRTETGMTIIVVGHRLSTIADADQIVVLERGRVAAAGSHAELRAAGGWYARALAKQRIDRPAVREEARERRYAAPK